MTKNNVDRNLFEVRQSAYIFNNKRQLLLLQNKRGTWGIVGGHLEFGETPKESLIREIKEETNTEVEMIDFINTRTVNKDFIIVYVAVHKNGNVKLSDEHLNWKWIDIAELKNYELTFPELKKEAEQSLEKISRRNI